MSNSKQMRELMKNPKAMMDFQTRGLLPKMRKPIKTPLWELLNAIPARDRMSMRGIRLSPKLGYQNGTVFETAEHLFRWLGGNGELGPRETLPSESYAIRSFRKKLTLDDVKSHCAQVPSWWAHRGEPKGPGL